MGNRNNNLHDPHKTGKIRGGGGGRTKRRLRREGGKKSDNNRMQCLQNMFSISQHYIFITMITNITDKKNGADTLHVFSYMHLIR
jgi:hypothetical protein